MLAGPVTMARGGWLIFWVLMLAGAAFFLADEIAGMARRYSAPTFRWSIRQAFASFHFVLALPIILLGPFQFSAALRSRYPRVHRRLGTIFIAASIVAAVIALYLGWTIDYLGSRVPLILFGTVWLGFSVAAWQTARARDFAAHRRFVIRSLALALAFVWVRVMGSFESTLFGFMPTQELRGTTREWLSFALPLVIVETWLSWWPSARRSFMRGR